MESFSQTLGLMIGVGFGLLIVLPIAAFGLGLIAGAHWF